MDSNKWKWFIIYCITTDCWHTSVSSVINETNAFFHHNAYHSLNPLLFWLRTARNICSRTARFLSTARVGQHWDTRSSKLLWLALIAQHSWAARQMRCLNNIAFFRLLEYSLTSPASAPDRGALAGFQTKWYWGPSRSVEASKKWYWGPSRSVRDDCSCTTLLPIWCAHWTIPPSSPHR